MAPFFTPPINRDLAEKYRTLFGDCDYGIPTLPHEQATVEFYEKSVQWCVDHKTPMETYWIENYPEEYESYNRLLQEECLL